MRSLLGFVLATAVLVGAVAHSTHAQQPRRYGGGERNPQPPKATLAIVGGMLIDGHEGPPVPHSVVLIDGNVIAAVGNRDTLKVPPGTKVLDASGMTVMPGLIDTHVHLDTIGHTDYQYWHRTYRSRIQDIYQVSATGMLQFGVTSALDLGAYADDVAAFKKKAESGEVESPRIRITGGFITNLSDEYIKGWHRGYQTANARTPEEARAAALKWIGYNVDVLKAYTGLTGAQVKAVSEEAHKRGLWVTGHAEGPENAIARIEAGQDAIEHLGGFSHGGRVPPDVIDAMLKHRTVVIPTLITSVAQLDAVQWPEFWSDNHRARSTMPPDIWADVRRSLEHPERVLTNFGGYVRWKSAEVSKAIFQQLREAGVTMLVGTDASTPINFKTDAMWREMDLMVQYGVPPMEVLATATRRNADYMKMGGLVGTVTRGKLADIIVIDGNPLVSMRDLRNVVAVVKDGRVYKGTTSTAPAATATEQAGGQPQE
jgi:imidazolonepropionase-like amidohydrolase